MTNILGRKYVREYRLCELLFEFELIYVGISHELPRHWGHTFYKMGKEVNITK